MGQNDIFVYYELMITIFHLRRVALPEGDHEDDVEVRRRIGDEIPMDEFVFILETRRESIAVFVRNGKAKSIHMRKSC